jgi:hypothetical protein
MKFFTQFSRNRERVKKKGNCDIKLINLIQSVVEVIKVLVLDSYSKHIKNLKKKNNTRKSKKKERNRIRKSSYKFNVPSSHFVRLKQ